jgi:hypothetical protein
LISFFTCESSRLAVGGKLNKTGGIPCYFYAISFPLTNHTPTMRPSCINHTSTMSTYNSSRSLGGHLHQFPELSALRRASWAYYYFTSTAAITTAPEYLPLTDLFDYSSCLY